MQRDIITSLNNEQRQAAIQQDGPILIIAGAGSGKTRVLTTKIALLLQSGVPADNILAITFTKKAAGEMKTRIRTMVGELARGLSIGTFHSVFVKLLRRYHECIGFPDNFTIYDEDDSESCLKTCIGEVLYGPDWNDKERIRSMSTDEKAERKMTLKAYKPKKIRSYISLAKNDLVLPRQYRNNADLMRRDARNGCPLLADIYERYMRRCHTAGAMDFDDILVYMHYLLSTREDIRYTLSDRFRYILVDEYQDTNRVQYDIVRMLAAVHGNICVVGDDSQSIYAFRGADIRNILNFQNDYPGVRTFRLQTNYRSTSQIVEAANRLISHNEARLPKTCNSGRGRGDAIRVEMLPDDREEARFVRDYIADAVRKGARYTDFAVLYRTNAQARAIEDEFIRSRVPYMIYSGMSFFDRAEVKDVLAYFRLVVNPKDDEAYKRICNRPARGVSDATLSSLTATAASSGAPLSDEVDGLTTENSALKPKAIQALREFNGLIRGLKAKTANMDAYTAAQEIVEATGILEFYRNEEGEDGLKKSNNIKELLGSIQYFVQDTLLAYEEDLPEGAPRTGLLDYLENIALLSNADTQDRNDENKDCVSLMTSHCSKGLEFPTVFVVGCEEGLFPLVRDDSTHFDEEEERRLFYVSITRAMDRLILTSCGQRWKYGSVEEAAESHFVKEMALDSSPEPSIADTVSQLGGENRVEDEYEDF